MRQNGPEKTAQTMIKHHVKNERKEFTPLTLAQIKHVVWYCDSSADFCNVVHHRISLCTSLSCAQR